MYGFVDWNRDTYDKDTQYVRSSHLKMMLQTKHNRRGPRAYYDQVINPIVAMGSESKPDSDALTMGDLFHKLILDGEVAWQVCADRRGSKAHDQAVENCPEGVTLIKPGQEAQLWAWRDGLMRCEKALEILDRPRRVEQAVLFPFEVDGVNVYSKAAYDILNSDYARIDDLKTTQASSDEEFIQEIIKYRYDVSAAMYTYGLCYTLGLDFELDPPEYGFIVVNKNPPYNCFALDLPPSFLRTGMRSLDQAYRTWVKCHAEMANHPNEEWKAFPDMIQSHGSLEPPDWFLSEVGFVSEEW